MAGKKDEFDVLTFFVYVMLLLTVIVGGFAGLNQRKVNAVSNDIRKEIKFLAAMQKQAMDEDLRGWISRDRDSGSKGSVGRGAADFQALIIKLSRDRRHPLRIENQSQEQPIPHPGGFELPFRLVVKKVRMEHLVKFLLKIEETWPGARVKKFDKLQYSDKDGEKRWEATVVLSIFKANT
jgi:hypothetical protein